MTTCGTPSFIYIAPVIKGNVDLNIEFFHNTSNDFDQFIGYDIYYKLYDNNDAGERCRSDKDYIEDSSVVVLGDSRLLNRQYRRLVKNNDPQNEIPVVIPPNKNSTHTFILSVADHTDINSISTITNSPNTGTLQRNVRSSELNYKPLNAQTSNYSAEDSDIKNIIDDINSVLNGRRLHAGFYAIGYGIDDNFQTIYGQAIFLGYISMFQTPNNQNCT